MTSDKMEHVSEELRVAEVKRTDLRNLCLRLHSQATDVHAFSLNWEDLDAQFSIIKSDLEKRCKDAELFEQQLETRKSALDQRFNEIESKEEAFRDLEIRFGQCCARLVIKRKKLGIVQKSMQDCDGELNLKEKKLDILKNMVQETNCQLELAHKKLTVLQNLVANCCCEIDLKHNELVEIQTVITERSRELGEKEKHIDSLKLLMVELAQEVDSVKELIITYTNDLESRKAELESIQMRIGETKLKLESKEKEVESAEKQLNFMKRNIQELHRPEELRKSLEECLKELDVCALEFEKFKVKEKQFYQEVRSERWKLILKERELSMREKEINFSSLQKEKEAEMKKDILIQAKRKQPDSMLKERQLEESIQAFKCKEEKLDDCKPKESEKRCEYLKPKEEDLSTHFIHPPGFDQKLTISTENLVSNDFLSQVTPTKVYNVRLTAASPVSGFLKLAPDPFKFVLDALQGYRNQNPNPSEGNEDLANCILLLEELICNESLELKTQVQTEALTLASEWFKVQSSFEILGFVALLAAYRLVNFFDKDNIFQLFGTISLHQLAPCIARALDFSDKVPGLIATLIEREEYTAAARFTYSFQMTEEVQNRKSFIISPSDKRRKI